MKQVKWAISTEIFRKPGFPQIDDALKRNNVEFFHSDFDSATRTYADIPYGTDECVIMYGPIKFIRTKNKGYVPGPFGFKSDTDVSHYMSQLPSEWFFNEDAIWLPWGSIVKKKKMLADIFGKHLFIRPDSGFKSFTGFNVKIDDLETEFAARQQTENTDPYEMCLIAKGKPIIGEYRMVVCNGRVITGSQYRWDDKLDVRIDVHHEAWAMAEQVASHSWQLDTCYVVDIFLGEHGPRIGEFNSFSSSGLYNCDLDAIVKSLSQAASMEYDK
jgi:hypothetical protein